MKVVILCGGLGSRLSEETKIKPKPLVEIGNKPILWHIMKIYKSFGLNNFILALGYKGKMIEDYFRKNNKDGFIIQFVNTGKKAKTGARLLKLKKYLKNEDDFMLTYGDGVSNVNIKKLLNFHLKNKPIATVTAVNPPVRFGELKIKKNLISEFREKAQAKHNWISGGFFVFSKKIFEFIPRGDNAVLEEHPFTRIVKIKKFNAYKHKSFWQCMDTMREKQILNKLWRRKNAKWKNW